MKQRLVPYIVRFAAVMVFILVCVSVLQNGYNYIAYGGLMGGFISIAVVGMFHAILIFAAFGGVAYVWSLTKDPSR